MTIGPEPMTRMLSMSVRLGIGRVLKRSQRKARIGVRERFAHLRHSSNAPQDRQTGANRHHSGPLSGRSRA